MQSQTPITTQKKYILQHLKAKKKITPMKALEFYQCFRLAAVIHRLRGEGHKIEAKLINDKWNGKRYSEYKMK